MSILFEGYDVHGCENRGYQDNWCSNRISRLLFNPHHHKQYNSTATYLDNLLDSVQIAQMILEGGNDVQPALPRSLVPMLNVHPILAGRAGDESTVIQQW